MDVDDIASNADMSVAGRSDAGGNSSKKVIGVKAYMTYQQRLDSFAKVRSRKRSSTAKGAKTAKLQWPTECPSAEAMADAGFYYKPDIKSPDNACCFLCQKFLDGWEPEDDPAKEHLTHNPECGWAVAVCAITANQTPAEDPKNDKMLEGRVMTFAKWWPHENKMGWKAKVENLAKAGFVYMPKPDLEDRVMCPYCRLQVDGWEPKDNPKDLHFESCPHCPFFRYGAEKSPPTPVANEVDVIEVVDEEETTAPSKGKKGKVPKKGKKSSTAPKKQIAITLDEDTEGYQDMVLGGGSVDESAMYGTPPKKSRGKKRKSTVMEAGAKTPLFNQEAINAKVIERQIQHLKDQEEAEVAPPAPKRRVTRASLAARNANLNLNVSVPTHLVQSSDDEDLRSFHNTPAKPKKKSGRKTSRASSQSRKSKGRKESTNGPVIRADMDDDEIDRALELDLQRHLSDEENGAIGDPMQFDIKDTVVSPMSTPEKPKSKRRLTRSKPARESVAPSEPVVEEQQPTTTGRRRLTRTKPPVKYTDDEDTAPTNKRQSLRARPYGLKGSRPSSKTATAQKGKKMSTRVSKNQSNQYDQSETELDDNVHHSFTSSVRENESFGDMVTISVPSTKRKPQSAAEHRISSASEDAANKKRELPKRGRPSKKKEQEVENFAVEAVSPEKESELQIEPETQATVIDQEDIDLDEKIDYIVSSPIAKKATTTKKGKASTSSKRETKMPSKLQKSKTKSKGSSISQKQNPETLRGKVVKDYRSDSPAEDAQPASPEPSSPEIHREDEAVVEKVDIPTPEPAHDEILLDQPEELEEVEVVPSASEKKRTSARNSSKSTVSRGSSSVGHKSEEARADAFVDQPLHEQEDIKERTSSKARRSSSKRMQSSGHHLSSDSSQESFINTQFTDVSGRETQATDIDTSSSPPRKGVSFAELAEQQIQTELELSFSAEAAVDQTTGPEGEDKLDKGDYRPDLVRQPLSTKKVNFNAEHQISTPSRQLVIHGAKKALVTTNTYEPITVEPLAKWQGENLPPSGSSLTKEEQRMTIGQWIKHCASISERRVLNTCDNIVKEFEAQGQRAIAAVEGIEVDSY